ncbi:MAG TPA: DUF3987 domain-containing protein, partial [Phycisphaerales bacterium]|nr:DUF3987 domain-containing protein [Phycisphaerales bacterium]
MASYNKEAAGQHDSALTRWAERLGVSADSLDRLGATVDPEGAIVFPMQDAERNIIGHRRRLPFGQKLSIKGSKNGLFVPTGPHDYERLYIAEGPTDTAALLSMDLPAIGLPGTGQCIDSAVSFVRQRGVREVVIVSDRDDAGRLGAKKLAEALEGVCSVRVCEPPEPHKDLRDWLRAEPLLREHDLIEHSNEPKSSAVEIGDDWPEIIDVATDPVPAFPLDALAPVLGDYAEAVAESLQVPHDMPALLGLAIGSFALSTRVDLRPEPDWWEPCNLWVCCLMRPAERKSAVLRLMRAPLDEHQRSVNESLAEQIEKTHRQEKALRARLDRMIKKVANADDPAERYQAE